MQLDLLDTQNWPTVANGETRSTWACARAGFGTLPVLVFPIPSAYVNDFAINCTPCGTFTVVWTEVNSVTTFHSYGTAIVDPNVEQFFFNVVPDTIFNPTYVFVGGASVRMPTIGSTGPQFLYSGPPGDPSQLRINFQSDIPSPSIPTEYNAKILSYVSRKTFCMRI